MAYAVVISLKQTLEPLLDSARSRIQISKSELEPIYEDLCYLKSFFDKMNSLEDSNSIEELEKDIQDLLQNTRDLIESHLSDLVHSESESSGDGSLISGFSRELVEVKDKLGPLINTLKAKENDLTGNQQLPSDLAVDVAVPSIIDQKIVGLKDELVMLQQRLLERDSRLQLIYIVGMAGIGKTSLAHAICNDQYILDKFDKPLFETIGIEYQLENLLQRISRQVLKVSEVKKEQTVHELGNRLKASLSRRTYLVILDDLRDMRVWDQLQPFFPDEGNGSRIVFTTRKTNVDHVANDGKYIFQKRLLDNQESWELFCKMAFSEMEMDKSPSDLEEIGKTIAKSLRGLPLALVEIGKHVSKLPTKVERWKAVARNINLYIRKTAIPNVLSAGLPQHLKSCFLYLGLFQPSYDIPASQLIKLWVAEGFIEEVAYQSSEKIAEEYLEDLVSSGLVIVHERSSTGGIKTCGIFHQVLRDICVMEARQQKLFHVVSEGTTTSREGTKTQRRLSIQSDVVLEVMESNFPGVRSLVFMCPQHQDPLPVFVLVRWLRVLHALHIRFSKFPDEVLKLVRLRYLAIKFDGELPSSISRLWNLEVLIICPGQTINSPVFLPLEIWKLQRLRHLHCMGFDLPDPSTEYENDLCLNYLLTLSGVSFRSCGEEILAKFPKIIKLGIWFDPADHAVDISSSAAVFSHLRHLGSFKCTVTNPCEAPFSLKGFPSGLRKLNLGGCGFLWYEHSSIISHLPNLQVLKLRRRAFCGPKWELGDDVYRCVKFLVLEDLDIEQLIAESVHFPVLQQLHIRHCYLLQEIPLDMGYIPTLEVIEVDDCRMSLIKSALRIQECLQEELGHDDLQVRIHSSFDG